MPILELISVQLLYFLKSFGKKFLVMIKIQQAQFWIVEDLWPFEFRIKQYHGIPIVKTYSIILSITEQ